jgi:hypothetical protein
MVKFIIYLREHVAFLKVGFFGILIAILVFDFFVVRDDTYFWGDTITCFWALFAVFGSLFMSILCKGIYHVWLMRETNYYDS